jgi:predicted TIM-barrel fold metal-dependent hydrolase
MRRPSRLPGAAGTIIDAHTHVGISARNYLTTAYPYAMSIEDLVVRMDLLGITQAVVMPFDSSYYLAGRGRATRKGSWRLLSSFPYEKENTSLLVEINDVFSEHRTRFFPFAMFDPSRETARQARHLRRLHRRYGLRGLKTVTTYNRSFVKDFQSEGNPIREFAREAGLPLIFHCSWIKTDIWANVFDILDVVEGNPDVCFCVAHAARFSREALDRAAALPNCYVDTSAFKIHCDLAAAGSAAVAPSGRRFASDYRDPARVMRDLILAYPGTLLWGSDTPYHYFAQPWRDATGAQRDVRLKARYDDEVRILKALPKRLVSEIAHTNTLRFLSNRMKGMPDV